jgi:predicted RNA binding protein YcfA (HicA-like mRNA interferase family)
MSPKAPRLTGKALIKALEKKGFAVSRINASHHFLRYVDGRTTVVPVHRGETLGPGLLSKIRKDCDVSASEITKS